MDVLAQIRHSIHKHALLPRGGTLIVGVSGGPDSLCLLHALRSLRAEFEVNLHVAHLNHQLRGAEADADAQFIEQLAKLWGLPVTLAARDVAALASENKQSIEEAARQARYAFLAETALNNECQTIAVAHNADDQSESVLMHFLRGSGPSGLRGMLPIRDLGMRIADSGFGDTDRKSQIQNLKLIRPLLNVSRADVEAYCREHKLKPRFDKSNLDTTFFRNRLRLELLPQLESYNPNIREVLRRSAKVIAADVEVLQAALKDAWRKSIASETKEAIVFNLSTWRSLSLAMQRATLRKAIERLRPSLRDVNFVHIENAVEQLQTAHAGTRVTLPQKLMLTLDYQTFSITHLDKSNALPDWPLLPEHEASKQVVLTLTAPGTIQLPDCAWSLTATSLDSWPQKLPDDDPWSARLDADLAGFDLSIRARVSGDRFHPQGMPSPVKLTNWMTNVKIPRRTRDRLPLILVADKIVWVTGYRIGQPFIVTPKTRRVLLLEFSR